jgi:hypothetical protein
MSEAVEEGFRREMAGDLAGGRASYAVTDDEGSEFGQGSAGVLVGVADLTRICAHGKAADAC